MELKKPDRAGFKMPSQIASFFRMGLLLGSSDVPFTRVFTEANLTVEDVKAKAGC